VTTKALFTPKEMAELRDRLQEELRGVRAQRTGITEAVFSQDQADSWGENDQESADVGTSTFEREKELSISNSLADLEEKIERALAKIDAGTYGLCERCGKPIEKARIRALPYASLCLSDKQAEERLR
jgi:RNA polymerase-binding transcription factor DksA